jgi:glycosyltransferase involved in cell wall biosynthesis
MKKKIIVNFHGEDLTKFHILPLMLKTIFCKICDKSDLIIVPSEYFKKKLLLIKEGYNSKIFVSPSGGINTLIFDKNIIPLPRNKIPEIIYCSRFDENKGWDDFINAIALLEVKCTAIMIGYGYETSRVRQLIIDKKLEEVIFLYENISQIDIQKIYSNADLFVFPTRLAESLGLVALEAMSCGLPVIGTGIGALSEYLLDGYNGYVFEVGNISSLAMNIQNFLQLDDNEKQILSNNAYNISKEYFDTIISKELIKKLIEL